MSEGMSDAGAPATDGAGLSESPDVTTSSAVPSKDPGDGDVAGGEAKESKPKAAPKTRKRKIRHRGEEFDLDPDDDESLDALVKRLSSKYRVRIDKEDREVDYDDLVRDYETRAASHDRMRKATEREKAFEQKLAGLRENQSGLSDFLEDELGVNPWEVLLAHHKERADVEALNIEGSPTYDPRAYAEKLAEQARKDERRKIERERAREEAQRKQREAASRNQQFMTELNKELESAGLEMNPITAGTLRTMNARLAAGGQEVNPRDLVYEVQRQIRDLVTSRVPTDVEQLAEFLGEERLKALAKRSVAEVKKGSRNKTKETTSEKPEKSKSMTYAEFKRSLRG